MKTSSFFIIMIVITQSVAFTEISANDTAFEKLATFDCRNTINDTPYQLPLPAVVGREDIPVANQSRPTLSQILENQAEGTNNRFYSAEEIAGLIREDYGDEPTQEDKNQIARAMALLQTTNAGTEMCKSIAYNCSIESLEKAGIRIRVKDIPLNVSQYASGISLAPIRYAGRTFLGLGKSTVQTTSSTHLLALALLHEMSHIEDLRKNQTNGTLAKAAYASEEKALMNEIAGYDEIVRKQTGFSNDFYEFLVEVWAWKDEEGAYPKDRYFYLPVGPKGEYLSISAHTLLKNYMPGLSFWDSIQKLVRTLWYSSYKNPKEDKKLIEAIRRSAWKRSVVYRNWRKDPYGHSSTPPPQTPETPNDDTGEGDNGGAGGNTGGSGQFNPGQYNPNFGAGI